MPTGVIGRRMPAVRDLWQLTKPGITRMCLVTTAGGLLLAPVSVTIGQTIAALLGSALAVSGANTYNMWLERDTDRLMARTKRRPLPAGRVQPSVALVFATVLSLLSLVVLAVGTNLLSACIAAFAIASYVLIYTPLKYRTPAALVIGAVPGAVPPLLGWTAATNSIDLPGMVLFAVLLIWQIPHFLAIALYRKAEYAKAGIKVVPLVHGDAIAKIQAVAWSMLLLPASLMLVPLGFAGSTYLVAAVLLGTGFLTWSFTGLDNAAGPRWARGFFLASLVYLPGLTLSLVADWMV